MLLYPPVMTQAAVTANNDFASFGVIGVPVALDIPIGLIYQHVARKIKQSYKCSRPHK